MKNHRNGSQPSEKDWVWVFGSNLAGIHGAGAALVAREKGLPNGKNYGIGYFSEPKVYAIPTKNFVFDVLSIEIIRYHVEIFKEFVLENPDKKFFITAVGTGYAGYTHSDIAPLFKGITGDNISVPEEWLEFL